MRVFAIAGLAILWGCAATPSLGPREYQDEQTAATIKVVADPLVFAQDPGTGGRDFLNVYAIDVNRMGRHQQYLAAMQWWPEHGVPVSDSRAATLELASPEQTLSFTALTQSSHELGIAQQIDATAPRDAKWFYFPVSKDVLGQVSKASTLRATLIRGEHKVAYDLWQDKRADVAELTEVLP